MEMHQVRYFLAAVRTLNFTRAAEECNVTQPSLTRAIQKLEEEFGGPLFRRERSLTHLTELGRQMVPHLQQTFDAAQAAKLLAKGIGTQLHAPVTLGLAGPVSDQLGTALSRVVQGLPGFRLSLVKADTAAIVQGLLKGDIDAAILPDPCNLPDRLNTFILSRQQLAVIAPATSALGGPEPARVQDLATMTWIEADPHVAAEFCARCSEIGIRPDFRHHANLEVDLVDLVANGLGCAWVPAGLALPDKVRSVAVADMSIARTTVFATVAGRRRSVATDTLARALRVLA
ncbi:LysR family transcriptional regulator [Blastomonas sp. SL216]|uniref:LysR family transcriptional regulator n=1 Tax=Blastomonas sp. SL216 TaxID=2995169 RepID=UPI0023772D1D|nr:LysR family transcriptional regulator [Blastomonas sp. SL216]